MACAARRPAGERMRRRAGSARRAGRPGAGPSGRRWGAAGRRARCRSRRRWSSIRSRTASTCAELENVTADPGPEPYRTATLYGDPSLDDTLDGPVLLVGRSSGSASIGGPPCCEGRTVDLGDREGLLGARRRPDLGEHRPRTLGLRRVRRRPRHSRRRADRGRGRAGFGTDMAPETATSRRKRSPRAWQPLVVGAPADGPFTAGAGEVIVLDGESTTIHISAVRADPGCPHCGASGPTTPQARWSADSRVPSANCTAASSAMADAATCGPRTASCCRSSRRATATTTWTTWCRTCGWAPSPSSRACGARRSTGSRPPRRSGCTDGTVVTAVDGDLRWGFGLQPDTYGPGTWSDCTRWFTLTSASPGTSGSFTLPPLGQIAGSAVGGSLNNGLSGSVVGGVVPPGTARVTVLAPDGRTLEALLGDPGPRPGERIFGTFARGVVWGPGSPPYVVTAYDSAGAVLATQQL